MTLLFIPIMTRHAIRKTKNTSATSPDGISYLHLKHLCPHGIKALADIFNLSLTTNSIPNIWKLAKIIPILKPNKSPTEPASYRPISLLCNPSKMLERLVLNNITPHIKLSPSQYGFRSQHSTSTLLTNLTQTILEGLNSQKPAYRSLLAAVDINKAFDTVPRHLLIKKILNTHTHPNFKNGLPTSYQVDKVTQFTIAGPPEHYTTQTESRRTLSSHQHYSTYSGTTYPPAPNQTLTLCYTKTTLQYSLNTQSTRPLPHNYNTTSTH